MQAIAPAAVLDRPRSRLGLWLALVVLAAPSLLERTSILAPDGVIGLHIAKTIEAGALGWLVLWLIRERWVPRPSWPITLGTLYVVHALVSVLWVDDTSVFRYEFSRLIHVYTTALALYSVVRDRIDLEHAVLGWKAVSLATALLVVVEMAFPRLRIEDESALLRDPQLATSTIEDGLGPYVRASGPQGHANWLGFFLGVTLLLTPWLWTRYRTRRARALLLLTAGIEAWALLEAHVRLGTLGLAVGTLWLVLRGALRYRLLPLFGLATGFAVLLPLLPATWVERTLDPGHLATSASLTVRSSMLEESIPMARRYGGLGVGYGMWGERFHRDASGTAVELSIDRSGYSELYRPSALGAHNAYLEVVIEQGLPGLWLFLGTGLTLLALLQVACRVHRGTELWTLGMTLEAMLIAMGVMHCFLHAQDQRVMWTTIALGAAYVGLTQRGQLGPAPELAPAARRATRLGLGLALAITAVCGILLSL